MRPRPQISVTEGIALGTCVVWPTSELYLPSVIATAGREDGWLGLLAGALVVIPVALVVAALAGRLPHMGLPDQAQVVLGRWLGRIPAGIFVLGTAFLAAYAVRAGTDMVGLLMLPRTPPWVVAAVIVGQAAVGAYYGLEVVARAAVIAFLAVAAVLVILIAGFVPLFDARYLVPVLSRGPGPPLVSAAIAAGFWGQQVLGAMGAHAFRGARELRAAVLGAAAASVLAGWLLFTLGQGAAGWYGMSRLTLPTIELVRSVRMFLPLLERVDVLVVIGWTAMGFAQVAWLLWACAWGSARVAGLVDARPLLPLWTAAIFAGAVSLPEDLAVLIQVWTGVFVPVTVAGLIAVVLLLWLVAALRGVKPEKGRGGR
ncbi:MAG: GerAB/ArcD/ProY family transporter [Bacillota bacterium]